MRKPLCIDLYAGLGGWAEGFLAEGWDVVGFDIERHDYGTGGYPGWLVLQDVTTLHGSQFKDASCIVASPPCQGYSYRAMPWKRAKALPPPDNTLFFTCWRIQQEAIEAAGRFIPLVVENVRGAQKWVGRSAWHFGSFHLWGDLPALMPISKIFQKFNPDGTNHPSGSWFAIADSKERGARSGLKLPNNNGPRRWEDREVKRLCDATKGIPHKPTGHWTNPAENGCKQGGDWFSTPGSISLTTGGRSDSRKAASAQIAKIPFPLSSHIARVYKPEVRERHGDTLLKGLGQEDEMLQPCRGKMVL